MFTVALLMGILIGFVLGRISATAFEDKPTPAPEPTETAFVISTPEPVNLVQETPEPVLLGTYRITAYCSCEKCCGEWARTGLMGLFMGLPVKNWLPVFPVLPRCPLEQLWRLKAWVNMSFRTEPPHGWLKSMVNSRLIFTLTTMKPPVNLA